VSWFFLLVVKKLCQEGESKKESFEEKCFFAYGVFCRPERKMAGNEKRIEADTGADWAIQGHGFPRDIREMFQHYPLGAGKAMLTHQPP
jgi:hypothetical protein